MPWLTTILLFSRRRLYLHVLSSWIRLCTKWNRRRSQKCRPFSLIQSRNWAPCTQTFCWRAWCQTLSHLRQKGPFPRAVTWVSGEIWCLLATIKGWPSSWQASGVARDVQLLIDFRIWQSSDAQLQQPSWSWRWWNCEYAVRHLRRALVCVLGQ